MFQADFENISAVHLNWLSQFSGMALLNWGFFSNQIEVIWSRRGNGQQGEASADLLSSDMYLNSQFRFGITSNRYLRYDIRELMLVQIPIFSYEERAYLNRYADSVLESWGFSHTLISVIRTTPITAPRHLPLWLKASPKYKDSLWTFNSAPLNAQYIEEASSPVMPNLHGFSFQIEESPISTGEEEYDENEPVASESAHTNTPSSLTGDTVHDLQVKYQGTYGLYNSRPIYLNDISQRESSPNGYEIFGKYCGVNGELIESFKSWDVAELNLTVPKLGFINHTNLAILLERKHKKQSPTRYRKGLRADSLTITNISRIEYKEAYSLPDPYDTANYGEERVLAKLLHSLLTPVFYSYEEALSLLLSFKRLSCAITSSIALALDFRTNKIILYRNQFLVGSFDSKTNGFILETPIFTDDLTKAGVIIK